MDETTGKPKLIVLEGVRAEKQEFFISHGEYYILTLVDTMLLNIYNACSNTAGITKEEKIKFLENLSTADEEIRNWQNLIMERKRTLQAIKSSEKRKMFEEELNIFESNINLRVINIFELRDYITQRG